MNRLSRDELIHNALDLADLPSLDQHDRPGGVILEHAWSIQWLQQGLDWMHHKWPFAGAVKSHPITMVNGTNTYPLPADFVLDVRNGMVVIGNGYRARGYRTSLTKLLQFQAQSGAPETHRIPQRYVVTPPNFVVFPTPEAAYTGSLWYYSLPNVLQYGTVIPLFPSDWVLVEYLRIRGLEHMRQMEPGSSMIFANKAVGEIEAAGLGRELEADEIELDPRVFPAQAGTDFYQWMGRTTVP